MRFHPLGPAFLVAPTGIKLPACSSTPLVVTTGATPTTHAVDKPATAVLVRLSASLSGLVPVCSTSPKAPPLASFPCMFVGFLVSFPCGLAVCFGDLGVCFSPFGQATTRDALVAAPGTIAADAEALRAPCDIGTGDGCSSGFNQRGFGHHILLDG